MSFQRSTIQKPNRHYQAVIRTSHSYILYLYIINFYFNFIIIIEMFCKTALNYQIYIYDYYFYPN